MIPVILCGGSGARLWPISRAHRPKQFLSLHSDSSMLEDTCKRLRGLTQLPPIVIANEEHRFQTAEALRCLGVNGQIILEPCGRNTAPAIALAAMSAFEEMGGSSVLLILPADHRIDDVEAFQAAIKRGEPQAEEGKVVVFGVVADRAETGFGYIRSGGVVADGVCSLGEFVEKPDAQLASQLLSSGDYLWNSGIFMFRADVFLNSLQENAADIYAACREAFTGKSTDLDFIRVDQEAFKACRAQSIDFAIMEKITDAVVVPMDVGWNDLGSWPALYQHKSADGSGNVLEGDVLVESTNNCYIASENRLVAAVGVDNLFVVDTDDALMVAHRDSIHEVRKIVEKLELDKRSEYLHHRQVYRPWGKFDSIDAGSHHCVKHISVNPQSSLSLQRHQHRAEHWVVVSGQAEVRCGERCFTLESNQSTYIPRGVIHQLSNVTDQPLEVIEVQTGEYLGEDDIERFTDSYGRS